GNGRRRRRSAPGRACSGHAPRPTSRCSSCRPRPDARQWPRPRGTAAGSAARVPPSSHPVEPGCRGATARVTTAAADHASREEERMANHVYKTIELTGSSTTTVEDAVSTAIRRASETVRNLRWFQVTEVRGGIENGQVAHWQVTMKVGFTLEG